MCINVSSYGIIILNNKLWEDKLMTQNLKEIPNPVYNTQQQYLKDAKKYLNKFIWFDYPIAWRLPG